jgi:hypothetical protein
MVRRGLEFFLLRSFVLFSGFIIEKLERNDEGGFPLAIETSASQNLLI